ncbi:MAG TPA: deoxyribodipyrimidine photo-lyase [Devosiaceae bacterium]
MANKALVWFRNDLRISDNPALTAAIDRHDGVLAVYVHESMPGLRPAGAAARWWLNRSLNQLNVDLAGIGVPLRVVAGQTAQEIARLSAAEDVTAVYWNRRYGHAEREVDGGIMRDLRARGLTVESSNASLLVEPFDIATQAGAPFAVFTPFWRALRSRAIPAPLPAPQPRHTPFKPASIDGDYIAPPWTRKLAECNMPGAAAAERALFAFVDDDLARYASTRDFPAERRTSLLSAHLRFGEIGPRQVWHAIRLAADRDPFLESSAEKFLSELGWREFCYHLMYHRADISCVPMNSRFEGMSWRHDPDALSKWQRGMTGIPMVDAGMRELWATGRMHNRVRMVVASFLTKNLLMDWRLGEQWFWETLVDADPASNPANWQWVAGCGADAAPYFRVFNPVLQGERFDPEGRYVRQWVPELADRPPARIHHPLEKSVLVTGSEQDKPERGYPGPLVDLKASRQRALDAYAALRE